VRRRRVRGGGVEVGVGRGRSWRGGRETVKKGGKGGGQGEQTP
jgi:hypothetical protein